ncbi:MAG: hypothetical protein AAGH89_08810 [Verrucomicrobiota bacterium]
MKDPIIETSNRIIKVEDEVTPEDVRALHAEMCKQANPDMTDDEIIAEWNRRSPEDPWHRS